MLEAPVKPDFCGGGLRPPQSATTTTGGQRPPLQRFAEASSALPPRVAAARRGFTLVELLMVVTVIGILLSVIVVAALLVVRSVKIKKIDYTRQSLEVAIANYRNAYGKWPMDASLIASISNSTLTVAGTNNWRVFDLMRVSTNFPAVKNPGNTNNIPFFDESTVMSPYPNPTSAECRPRSWLASPTGITLDQYPVGYQRVSDGRFDSYSIAFDFEHEKVTLSAGSY
jgi:prepilin-type N-terminal cleavage/methylation domain-containing protein